MNLHPLFRFAFIAVAAFVLHSCARVGSPEGGEKDTTPPELVSLKPENGTLHFSATEVVLTFNEYVKLNNVQQQLVVSPTLDEMPEFKIKKRSIIMTLKDPLLPNTTYNFNFGDAIVDVNEGNPLKSFSYVVSTGDYIDSLLITGVVVSAYTGTPQKDFTAMLYDTSATDSTPYLKKPLYLAKTNEQGKFTIKNLKRGEYSLLAINDINKDYKFQSIEDVAFLEGKITPATDSSDTDTIELKTFRETGDRVQLGGKKLEDFKKLIVGLNQRCNDCQLIEPEGQSVIYNQWKDHDQDTLFALLKPVEGLDSITFYLSSDTGTVDTLQFYPPKSRKKEQLQKKFTLSGTQPDANQYLRFTYDEPIMNLDSASMITLMKSDSSLVEVKLFQDSTTQGVYYLDYKPAPQEKITVFWPDSAFIGLYNSASSADTLNLEAQKLEYYGNLIFTVVNNLKDPAILVFTEIKANKVQFVALKPGSNKLAFPGLAPSSFTAAVIVDKNGNGIWDTGSYLKKKQAETVLQYKEPIQVRSNWDLELEWILLEPKTE